MRVVDTSTLNVLFCYLYIGVLTMSVIADMLCRIIPEEDVEGLSLTPIQRQAPHPLHTRIHRKRRYEQKPLTFEAEQSECLIRFCAQDNAFKVSMEGPVANEHNGIRCFSHCETLAETSQGMIPCPTLDEKTINYTVDSRQGKVLIEGRMYPLYNCLSRDIYQRKNGEGGSYLTNQDAITCKGKDDRCLIDDHFCAYFVNNEEGIIRLRHEAKQEQTIDSACNQSLNNVTKSVTQLFNRYYSYSKIYNFLLGGNSVQFSHPFFDRDPWTQCPALFVQIPNSFIDLLSQGVTLDTYFKDPLLSPTYDLSSTLLNVFSAMVWDSSFKMSRIEFSMVNFYLSVFIQAKPGFPDLSASDKDLISFLYQEYIYFQQSQSPTTALDEQSKKKWKEIADYLTSELEKIGPAAAAAAAAAAVPAETCLV